MIVGNSIKYGDQCLLRHIATLKYLAIDSSNGVRYDYYEILLLMFLLVYIREYC